ncbi:metallophosphoesterase [Alcanivorax sp.]|uniref:metallophosphoesterase n=1 Tax=Alcanivorax sp. TaxID=1872427 RepID=UPI0025C1F447|nr:metallophosphoesterase [Alcanivorax sp.]
MTQQLQPLRVVQLSDCHLFADTQGKLLGLNTQFSLEKVLELIHREQPNPDLILATGDLSQDASLESYQRLGEALSSFTAPVYWLEGNHDKPAPMLKALNCDRERMSPCVLVKFLDDALAAANGEHLMVCLHHHPVPMECAWLDTQVVGSAEQFFAVIDRHPRVRAIIWGHVHQEYDEQRNGVRLLAVPSTCVQFKPKSEDFAVDDANPGYRWLDLHPDGRIDTAVSRVEGITFEVDFSVKGY